MPVLPLRARKIGFSLLYQEPVQAQKLAKKLVLVSVLGKKPKAQVSGMRLALALVPW
jgi:hypothetical protein